MAHAVITIYAHKFTFGGATFDKTSGGPFRWQIRKTAQVIREHLDNLMPVHVEVVEGEIDATVSMKDNGKAFAIGDSGAVTLYAKNKDGEVGIPLGTCIVYDVQREQSSPTPGSMTVVMTLESATGADPDEVAS